MFPSARHNIIVCVPVKCTIYFVEKVNTLVIIDEIRRMFYGFLNTAYRVTITAREFDDKNSNWLTRMFGRTKTTN